ncbi:MAG: DUF4911 domain-containing protein [Deltaproteobacteria bacterium]|nr:DUF4911 domain-containing protein [Deltaproteobacteria bacterium]
MGKGSPPGQTDRSAETRDGLVARYLRIPLTQIAYVRFIIEAYDGLAQMTSYPKRCDVLLLIPVDRLNEAEALIAALAQEVGLQPVDKPADWPDQRAFSP